ncbi:MAG: AlkZ family DNA glycosylase [Armatimonadetes bacterium]|nr:AlkZ family DNA glycosylase [Armatimonadota bacterium]
MKTRSGSPTSPGSGSGRSTASVSASAPRRAAAGVLLTPEQVRAWRLARHHLDRRVPRTRLTQVVADLCGAHAQLMSAAELSLWARVSGLTQADVREALWERRTLVKTWGMRGTLHLFPAADLPLYAAALRTRTGYRRDAWLKMVGLTLEEVERVSDAVRAALDGRQLTREELADAVADRAGPKVRRRLLSGWGEMLKPAASRGSLIFGPSRGQHVTFVRPDQWLKRWRDLDGDGALREVLRRYLAAYGPATHDEFARWWGIDPAPARRLMAALDVDLEAVEVDGRRGWTLAGYARRIRAMGPPRGIRLLPNFDPYVMGYRPREEFVPADFAARVFRPQAWISPVLLVDGRAAGVWAHRRRGSGIEVGVEPFVRLGAAVKREVEDEGARLGAFLGGRAEVAFRG